MSEIEYYKVKDGIKEKIKKPFSLNYLLRMGFVVSEVITTRNKIKIITHSPRTFKEYKQMGGV